MSIQKNHQHHKYHKNITHKIKENKKETSEKELNEPKESHKHINSNNFKFI